MKTKKIAQAFFSAAAAVCILNPCPASAVIGVSGDLIVKNQTGVHDGEIIRNYLKADVCFNENFGNTEVKVILRAEDDSIRPDEGSAAAAGSLRNDTASKSIFVQEGYASHDIYFESLIDSINIKLGRIVYTWGTSDEVKPVDIINPQNYSNLYFTPIRERKYGVLSGTMSVYVNDSFFIEGVAVPEFRSSEISSAVFETKEAANIKANSALLNINEQVLPDKKISESSYAARVGLTLFDIDMHANYFYGYDHLPVYRMKLSATPTLTPPVEITPVYEKVQMFGFDFQRALLWGISARGEIAYFERGKYFSYNSGLESGNMMLSPLFQNLSSGGSGSVEKDYMEYTVGFDGQNFIFDDLYLNLQFHQKIIKGHEEGLSEKKYRNLIVWNIRYSMQNQKYRVSSQGAYDAGDKSVYGNIELSATLADNFEMAAGAWIVEGKKDTQIGQFDSKDMVYLSGKLTF